MQREDRLKSFPERLKLPRDPFVEGPVHHQLQEQRITVRESICTTESKWLRNYSIPWGTPPGCRLWLECLSRLFSAQYWEILEGWNPNLDPPLNIHSYSGSQGPAAGSLLSAWEEMVKGWWKMSFILSFFKDTAAATLMSCTTELFL